MQDVETGEPQRKARKWVIQLGALNHNVFIPTRMRLHKLGMDEYQLTFDKLVGRVFKVCPDWTKDQLQGFINQEADEVAMDVEIAIGG